MLKVKVTPIIEMPNQENGPWLAINLFDTDRVDPLILKGMIDTKAIRECEIRIDGNPAHDPTEVAVVFKCDLLKAATICDIIRSHDKAAGDYITRVYCKKTISGMWDRLPSKAILTLMQDGKSVLNRRLLGLPPEVIQDDNYTPQQINLT